MQAILTIDQLELIHDVFTHLHNYCEYLKIWKHLYAANHNMSQQSGMASNTVSSIIDNLAIKYSQERPGDAKIFTTVITKTELTK